MDRLPPMQRRAALGLSVICVTTTDVSSWSVLLQDESAFPLCLLSLSLKARGNLLFQSLFVCFWARFCVCWRTLTHQLVTIVRFLFGLHWNHSDIFDSSHPVIFNGIIFTFIYSLCICMCACTCVWWGGEWQVCRSQRKSCKSQFSPFTTWGPGMELFLSGLPPSTFAHLIILLAFSGIILNVNNFKILVTCILVTSSLNPFQIYLSVLTRFPTQLWFFSPKPIKSNLY